MNITFFETEDFEHKYFTQALAGHQLSFSEVKLNEDTADKFKEAEVACVFIYSKINKAVLDKMPKLKLVVTRSMGFNHIDTATCKARGIAVSYVPAYGERTVAEHTFALILSLSRKIFLAYERTEKGIFDYHGLRGFDLFGKTIGIVGGGRIGINVAKLAKAFGMEILITDPFPKPELAKEIGFTYVPLDTLLQKSEVITLHAPYSKETHHLINENNLKLAKHGAILINTARGGLLDTKALLQALENGTLSGAGLDVLEEECDIKEERELMSKDFIEKCNLATLVENHMLIARNDVIITPHIAFNSQEALERIMTTTVQDIEGFAQGSPVNMVPNPK